MKKKCSMCLESKELSEFRFLNKQNRHIAYCKNCEKIYNKTYQKARREIKKDRK